MTRPTVTPGITAPLSSLTMPAMVCARTPGSHGAGYNDAITPPAQTRREAASVLKLNPTRRLVRGL